MNAPPPLVWLKDYVESTGRAMGQGIVYELLPSVNPLMYRVKMKWPEPINGTLKSGMWNLFETWAHTNEASPEGKVDIDSCSMTLSVGVKRRFGDDKNKVP